MGGVGWEVGKRGWGEAGSRGRQERSDVSRQAPPSRSGYGQNFPASLLPRCPVMFLGHYAVALALKRAEPKLSLGTLFLAVQLCDLLWGAFLLLGWEHVRIVTDGSSLLPLEFYDYPISHSLVGTIILGVVAAALYYSWPTRDTSRHWQAAALVGLAVFSHFVLDLL